MKKFILALIGLLILSSCGTTYYIYYEVDSPEMATTVSKQDGAWSKNHK